MKRLYWMLLITLFFSTMLAHTASSKKRSIILHRQTIIEELSQNMPHLLCHPESYFLSCFQIPSTQCNKKLKGFFNSCAQKHLNSKKEVWNHRLKLKTYKIGLCAGDLFEKKFSHLKDSKNKKCSNLSTWL